MISFSRKWKALQNYWTRTLRNLRTSRSPSWPFLFPSVEFCEICCSCYFCHICCSIFSHSMKNSCYFCDFCEICGLTEALLDLSSFKCRILWNLLFLLFLPYLLLNLFKKHEIKILLTFAIFAKFADISKPFLTFSFFSLPKCRILWNLLFLLFLPYLLLSLFT